MKNVKFAVVNRNGKALLINGSTNKYSQFDHQYTNKASMTLIAKLLERLAESDKYESVTILLPKNLGFLLRKDLVNEWIANGNKAHSGAELDSEFIELAKYISDMRTWLGNKVGFKMTGTIIMTPEEELFMKQAWNQLDKLTNYKPAYNKHMINKPVAPKSISKAGNIEA